MGGKLKEDKTPINGELVAIGGFGKFQWFVVISMILGQMSGGFIAHGIAYLEMPPEYPGYLCTVGNLTKQTCAPEFDPDYTGTEVPSYFWCDTNSGVSHYEVDYEANPANLNNLYTQLRLGCMKRRATALIAMAVFAGSAIGCLFMPRLGDLLGRKPVFCFSLAFQAPLLASITFLHGIKLIYIAAFFFGICIIGRMACGFLLMMELVPTKDQAKVGAALMVAEGSVQIIWTAYFVFISQNAEPFLWGITVLNFVTAIVCFFILESPRYLYST